jgi:23S rRNA pseudouridine1911/1915/1917 synthase
MQLTDIDHQRPKGSTIEPLDRVLRGLFPGASWETIRRCIRSGKVRIDGATTTDPSTRAGAGASIVVRLAAPRSDRKRALSRDVIVFADTHLVVVDKPAGLSTVAYDENERDSLDRRVTELLKRSARGTPTLGVVHRLDKETSGLLVFSRTLAALRHLKQQFRAHTAHRRYFALAHGRCPARTIRSRLVVDRGDGLRGSTRNPGLGREAVTRVRPVEELGPATLLECALETGRTHQIRIHLAEAGHPLVGERVYIRGFRGNPIAAPRLMLHAAELGFVHPTTGRALRFEKPMPEDMQRLLERLRLANR